MVGTHLSRRWQDVGDLLRALTTRGHGDTLEERVRRYYEHCDHHYRIVCTDASSLALHYGYYDDGARTHADALLRMNEVLADTVGIRPGARVLDAGCGVGGSSMWLAAHREATTLGVTLVPNQVQRASRYAAERGLADRCSFRVADYADTGLESGSFDVVWAQESLCHAADLGRVLREARRVLRPGGRILISDGFRTTRHTSVDDERSLRTWLDGWVIPDLHTPEEVRTLLGEAGFVDIEVQDFTARVIPDARRMVRWAEVVWPAVRAASALGLIRATERGNIEGSLHQHATLERGVWRHLAWTATAGRTHG